MRSSKPFFAAVAATVIGTATAVAAHVDFNDPKRALGREGDVRVDAQLARDTVSPNAPVTVTYQIENLSRATVAVADKIFDITFDPDARTITFSIGAEVPPGPNMPHLAIIKPGEKRVLTGGAILHIATPSIRTPSGASAVHSIGSAYALALGGYVISEVFPSTNDPLAAQSYAQRHGRCNARRRPGNRPGRARSRAVARPAGRA